MTENKFTGTTVAELKKYLRANFEEGCICPGCGGQVKLYRRPLTSSMALSLVLIYKEYKITGNKYVHLETLFKEAGKSSGDTTKLRFWELISPQEGVKNDGNPNNGYYCVTSKGVDFLRGKTKVPSHVLLYNNKYIGASEKQITIEQAFKNKFNYSEIIQDLL